MANTFEREYTYIDITMPDQSVWRVPAAIVADSYAAYWSVKTAHESNKTIEEAYHEQYEDVIGNDAELLDWAANNMDWSEVKHVARIVKAAPTLSDAEKQEGWANGEKRVIRERRAVSTH